MTALENVIFQSKMTPYAFALKHRIANVYTKKKDENYNLKKVVAYAKKEGLNELNFNFLGCNVNLQLTLDEKIKQMNVEAFEEL